MAITIDGELCLGCGCCIDVCNTGALELNSKVIISEDDCTECKSCVEMCPVGAITPKSEG
jgi:electron transport complex protein RnfB